MYFAKEPKHDLHYDRHKLLICFLSCSVPTSLDFILNENDSSYCS